MKTERILAAFFFASLFAVPAGATKLKVSHVDIDFHTDRLTWHVKAKTCSKDSSDSGTILYELRLYQLAEPISAGIPHNTVAKWTDDPLHPKGCQTEDLPVTIDAGNVPADEYHVVLWVGDDNGSGRTGKNRYTASKTYIKQ
jgi:hypothetical protein